MLRRAIANPIGKPLQAEHLKWTQRVIQHASFAAAVAAAAAVVAVLHRVASQR